MSARNVVLGAAVVAAGFAGCAGEGDDLGRSSTGSESLALVSSSGEQGILRTGETLNLRSALADVLQPSTFYRITVANAATGGELSHVDTATDESGMLAMTTLLHDVGEFGGLEDNDGLEVTVQEREGAGMPIRASIPLDIIPLLQVPGFNVNEIQPPHIFAALADGSPANAFAVGGTDEGEVRGPIYVAGEGFPQSVAGRDVNIYVVRDRDDWRDRVIPTSAADGLVNGPIAGRVAPDGRLPATEVLDPALRDTGIYDILVDLDGNGRFDWSFSRKDGADGVGKVGFTVQYSESWLRSLETRHVLVNIAFSDTSRDSGGWSNTFESTQHVFMYLNPPVMHQYHFSVTKWIVSHADFDQFWNNPAMFDREDGTVCFQAEGRSMAIQRGEVPPQTGCTNTGPTCFGPMPGPGAGGPPGPGPGGMAITAYDVVFDRNGDGCYTPGEDLLDIVGGNITTGDIVSMETFRSLPAADQIGFAVR